ncbi:MAG: signal peptidase I [Bacteroidales bacterium]|nr:signal peptidase I [Bacteroidales bacterium]
MTYKFLYKYAYYLILALLAGFALLFIISIFPITGNIKIMSVLSGSMEPSIHTGSIVVVKPSSEYKVGDVITFGRISKTQTPTTHRIHEMKVVGGETIYITKGDANNAPDTKEITGKDIVGKVLFTAPYVGYAVNTAKKPFGFMLIIIVPAMIIIWDETKNIFAEVKKNKKMSKLE